MKKCVLNSLSLMVAASLGIAGPGLAQNAGPSAPPARERLLMDFNWKFALGNASDPKADFGFGAGSYNYLAKQNWGGVCSPGFDDSKWKLVNLPHDWGMDLPFDEKADGNWGSRPLGRQYSGTSVGWYRKTFDLPGSDQGRRIAVEFEGICHDCLVEVNGILVGTHYSGYTSFSFDITDLVHFGGRNVLVVRVDAQANEGWWYQGAGIYRNVWLTKTSPVHIPQWGTQVLTKMDRDAVLITANTEVANDSPQRVEVVVQSAVLDATGQTLRMVAAPPLRLAPWEQGQASSVLRVARPKLWSLESPTLYKLVTTLKVKSAVVDGCETPFGIRTLRFDPDQGFLLNGKPVRIKGVCDHEQQVIVGTAVPDSLWIWRVKKLKEDLGANAIRMSHNPPAPALLDACDRLGFLVMDEQRLFSSGAEGLQQLDSFVRRDRNHPSIIIWSAGNEEWGLQSSSNGAPVMRRLQEEFHRLDPSRPVTFAASNGEIFSGVNEVVEVRGINYLNQFKTNTPAEYHQQHPHQPVIGTEEGGQDLIHFMRAGNPWYAGGFIWTGFAYYGESGWPNVVAPFGALDLCGFPRDLDQYQKAWLGKNTGDPAEGITPKAIQLAPDRTVLNADGEDTLVVNLTVADDQNHRVGNATNLITIQMTGPGRILGLGNGNPADHSPDRDSTHAAFQGRAQLLVQATHEAGTITLQAASDGLQGGEVQIETRVGPQPLHVP